MPSRRWKNSSTTRSRPPCTDRAACGPGPREARRRPRPGSPTGAMVRVIRCVRQSLPSRVRVCGWAWLDPSRWPGMTTAYRAVGPSALPARPSDPTARGRDPMNRTLGHRRPDACSHTLLAQELGALLPIRSMRCPRRSCSRTAQVVCLGHVRVSTTARIAAQATARLLLGQDRGMSVLDSPPRSGFT